MNRVFTVVFLVICWTNSSSQNWTQIGSAILGLDESDSLGKAVALNATGDILAVGVPGAGTARPPWIPSGSVRVYQKQGQNWVLYGDTIKGDQEYSTSSFVHLGSALDINNKGDIIAIGGSRCRIVRVFYDSSGHWRQLGGDLQSDQILSSPYSDYPSYGTNGLALSADGKVLAIGEPGYKNGAFRSTGRVEVYRLINNSWVKVGSSLLGANQWDRFGYSVSLSGDGNVLAVGTLGNDYVKVFELQNGTWINKGSDIVGTQSSGFGYSLELSYTGERLVVGAPRKGMNGAVKAFQFSNGTWGQLGNELSKMDDREVGGNVAFNDLGEIIATSKYSATLDASVVDLHKLTNSNTWTPLGSVIAGFATLGGIDLDSLGLTVGIGVYLHSWISGNEYYQFVGKAEVYSLTSKSNCDQFQIFVRNAQNGIKSSIGQGNNGFLSLILGTEGQTTYDWKGPTESTNANPTNLKPGKYFLKVRDGNGCEKLSGPYFLR